MTKQPQELDIEAAKETLRVLFQDEPPLSSRTFAWGIDSQRAVRGEDLLPRSLQLQCQTCRDHEGTTFGHLEGSDERILYRCGLCNKQTTRIYFVVEEQFYGNTVRKVTTVRKIGQFPAWGPRISRKVERALGDRATYLRRAVGCLQEGYGIAACAYLRRIIEEEVSDILDLIEGYATAAGDSATIENLALARSNQRASDRLKAAAQVLPPGLKRGNVNPFLRLHDVFSEGIHHLSEEESVMKGTSLLHTFCFVFETLKESKLQFDDYVRKLSAT